MNLKPFVLFAGLAVLAACDKPNNLQGKHFVTKAGDTDITLSFLTDADRISGQVVNLYNASYTLNGSEIKFGEIATTMMMGPEDAMNAEQEYLQFMPTVTTYELTGERLVLKNADGKEMVFQQVEQIPDEIEINVTE